MKFKVGDRVKTLVDNYGFGYVEGEVCEVFNGFCHVSKIEHETADYNFGYHYRNYQIELIPKFKVGDRVRVLGKTKYCPKCGAWQPLADTGYQVGDEAVIKGLSLSMCGSECRLKIKAKGSRTGDYLFHAQDLELIQEKEDKVMKKWEIKKGLTFGELCDKSRITWEMNTMGEFDRLVKFLKGQGRQNPRGNILTDALIEYAEKHDCFIRFLVEGGYVERVEEETYSIGDRFKGEMASGSFEAVLCQTDHSEVNMVMLEGWDKGNRVHDSLKVENIRKITQKEFDKLRGSTKYVKLED